MTRHPRHIPRLAGRLLLVLLVAVLVTEAALRLLLGLGTPPLYEADPDFEYRLKPMQSVQRFGKRIEVNRWGMRSDDFGAHKTSPRELRVMVFGDSVVNGGSLIDQTELATSRLQASLRAALPSKSVIVGNVSAGSWGPGNWLGFARRHGFLDADVVVLMVNSGDFADNPTFGPLDANHPTHAPLLALQEALQRYLPRHLPAGWLGNGNAGEHDGAPPPHEVARGLGDLRAFLAMATEGQRTLLVVHHPDREELLSGRYADGFERIAHVITESGLPLLQLREPFTAIGAGIYRDGIHHTPLGQRALADALHQAVFPLLGSRTPREQQT